MDLLGLLTLLWRDKDEDKWTKRGLSSPTYADYQAADAVLEKEVVSTGLINKYIWLSNPATFKEWGLGLKIRKLGKTGPTRQAWLV